MLIESSGRLLKLSVGWIPLAVRSLLPPMIPLTVILSTPLPPDGSETLKTLRTLRTLRMLRTLRRVMIVANLLVLA